MVRLISVVIPVGRVDGRLDDQLAALAVQDTSVPWDLVLSANSVEAREALAEVVERHKDHLPLVTIVDASDAAGPSHARNVGWLAAAGDVILFCDADDVVDVHWVSAMTVLAQTSDIFGGRLDYEVLNSPDPSPWHHHWSEGPPIKFAHLPFVPSCNVGVRRTVLETVGGWDESLAAGEDTDLCWRAQYAGFALGYSPEAVVHYRVRETPQAMFRQHLAYGLSDVRLMTLHRGKGASRSFLSAMRDVLAVGKSLVLAPFSAVRRGQGAAGAGNLVGRVQGSLRYRTWVI
jgi:GT2 family glycosyltransferase